MGRADRHVHQPIVTRCPDPAVVDPTCPAFRPRHGWLRRTPESRGSCAKPPSLPSKGGFFSPPPLEYEPVPLADVAPPPRVDPVPPGAAVRLSRPRQRPLTRR